MASHSSVLAGKKTQGQKSLRGYSLWGHKESDKTDVTEHTHTHTHRACYGIHLRETGTNGFQKLVTETTISDRICFSPSR